jgi:autotransporter passenger strand-loop-strand repeat protein
MTTFTAPPTKQDLVLNQGDILNISEAGVARETTINKGGVENVGPGGNVRGAIAELTTINKGGVENVFFNGQAIDTTINKGGVEKVNGGTASDAIINNGGFENVVGGGVTIDTLINNGGMENVSGNSNAAGTIINNGGVLNILSGGHAFDVTFSGPHATLNILLDPLALRGTIDNWRVGDVIDFQGTKVTSVQTSVGQTGPLLTVTFDGDQKAVYGLSNQQANTAFKLQDDGHQGTILTLVHIVGVGHAHHEVAGHLV